MSTVTNRRSAPPVHLNKLSWKFIALFLSGIVLAFLYSSSTDTILNPTLDPSAKFIDAYSRDALILTAHPDDEVMFFSPVIIGLVEQGWNVRGLCISSGNASGLGDLRAQELLASYSVLGIPFEKVSLANHPLLQDGMDEDHDWDPALVANIVSRHLSTYPASLLVTFDHLGITKHPNHVPLSYIQPLLSPQQSPSLLLLKSPSLVTKFTGPIYAIFYIIRNLISPYLSFIESSLHDVLNLSSKPEGKQGQNVVVMVLSPRGYFRAIRAMTKHRSQLVWFRWLYITFSRLMWVNELVFMGP